MMDRSASRFVALVVTEKIPFPCKVFLRIAIVIKFNNYDSEYKFPSPSGLAGL